MLSAALFMIANTRKQPKCPSRDEWIEKMCVCVHTQWDHYSVFETLSCVTMWMNLEDDMLSEVSQPQKDKYSMISLTGGTEEK